MSNFQSLNSSNLLVSLELLPEVSNSLVLPPTVSESEQYKLSQAPTSDIPKNHKRWVKECVKAQITLEAKDREMTPEEYISQIGNPNSALSNTLLRITNDVKAGILSMPAGIAEFVQVFSSAKEIKQIASEIRADQLDLLPDNPTISDHVIKTGTEFATLFIPGAGVSRGMRAVQCISRNLATTGGAITSAVLESAKHAGEVYQTLINKGMSNDIASQNAEKIFFSDLFITATTNRFGVFGHGIAGYNGALPKLAAGTTLEGAQSATQQAIHNHYILEKPLTGTLTAGLLGMLTGGVLKLVNIAHMIRDFRKTGLSVGTKDFLIDPKLPNNDTIIQQNYERLAKKLKLTTDQKEAFKPQVEKDFLTHFGIPEDRVPTINRHRTFANYTGKDVSYGLVDIANLGGLNAALGREDADKIFRNITDALNDGTQRAMGNNTHNTFDPFRHGGDEVCITTTNLSREQLESAFEATKGEIDISIKEKNLNHIPHLKYPDDQSKSGVSIAFSTVKLDKMMPLKKALDLADKKIEVAKQKNCSDSINNVELLTTKRPEVDTILPSEPTANEITASKGALRSYLSKLPDDIRTTNQFLMPEDVYHSVHQQKAKEYKLTQEQARLLTPKIPRDPVTGYYTRFDRVQSLKRLIHFKGKTNTDCAVVGFEFINLTGINHNKGATEANDAFKTITQILESELKSSHSNNNITVKVVPFRNTGPRGEFHVTGLTLEQINTAVENSNNKISEFEKRMSWDAIPYPKDSHPTQNGVGLYTSVTAVNKNDCAATVYHDMDFQLKKADIARRSLGR